MRRRFTEDDGVQKAPSRRRAAARRYRNRPCGITGRRFRQLLFRLAAIAVKRGDHEGVAGLETATPGGRLVFHGFAALAEFIRALIAIGTNAALAAARARGRVGGRPTVATEEVIRAPGGLLPDPGRSITSIAKLLGVSPGTLCNHIPGLRELRAGAGPRQLEAPAK
ncbi:recombinase family protein [Streptomyces goshikiensis]|uniref:recombinase family protein n=1 Tax=Streptomyces goshikiensis TaxID=1942 RepID=UPI00381045F8